MEDAATILVIILSTVLSIFLIVGIVLLVMLVKLVKSTRLIVAKAEHVVDSAEAATEVFKNASGKLAILKIISNIIKEVNKHR